MMFNLALDTLKSVGNHYNIGSRENGTELLQLYSTAVYEKDWIKLEYNRLDDIIERTPAVLSCPSQNIKFCLLWSVSMSKQSRKIFYSKTLNSLAKHILNVGVPTKKSLSIFQDVDSIARVALW